jgi:hypothetical protein
MAKKLFPASTQEIYIFLLPFLGETFAISLLEGLFGVVFVCFHFLYDNFLVSVWISSKLPLLSVDKIEVFWNKQGGKVKQQSIMTQADQTETVVNDTRNLNVGEADREKYEILTFF